MKKIGLIIAMDKEMDIFAATLQNLLPQKIYQRNFYSGTVGDKQITAVVSGMGNVNAALCTADLINVFGADLIINVGVSGGLDPSLNIGDFVVGDDIVYHDVWCGEPYVYGQIAGCPLIFHSAPELTSLLPELRHGLLCCGDMFVSSVERLNNIKRQFPNGLAVDMESAAIAQTCYLYNKPMLSVRQISDIPGVKHHIEQYDSFWHNAPQNSVKLLNYILEKL